ncbi:MAG: hypothetical protein ACTHNU_13115 [Gaiellales bacterium]
MQQPQRPPHEDHAPSDRVIAADDQERCLDDALEGTFPASDPVAVETPER